MAKSKWPRTKKRIELPLHRYGRRPDGVVPMFLRIADSQADFETEDGTLKGNVSLPVGGNAVIVQLFPTGQGPAAWETYQLNLSDVVQAAIRWYSRKHRKVTR